MIIRRILSPEAGPFWQFVKYGVIGVMATAVQAVVFYVLAATALPCLKADDWVVRHLALPSTEVSDSLRSLHFAGATALGFIVANIFCWLMNRWFVFRTGKHVWYIELALFSAVSGLAMVVATGIGGVLIHRWGLMTTFAFVGEVILSFVINFVIRKFVIFKG
ncbi:MAG: GtrA family protein [Kiritimatiellia bacterium]